MTNATDQSIQLTTSEPATGVVRSELVAGGARLTATQDGFTPFFICDHNYQRNQAPLLVLVESLPFELQVTAAATRGLQLDLRVPGPQDATPVAQTTYFSPDLVDQRPSVALDRFSDGTHARLAAIPIDDAEHIESREQKSARGIFVSALPVVQAEVASVHWNQTAPIWDEGSVLELAQALKKLPPARGVYRYTATQDLHALLRRVKELVRQIDPLDQLASTHAGAAPPAGPAAVGPASGVASTAGRIVAAPGSPPGAPVRGAPGKIGAIVHATGRPAPPLQGVRALPVKVIEAAAPYNWEIRVLVCRNLAEADYLRQTVKPKEVSK